MSSDCPAALLLLLPCCAAAAVAPAPPTTAFTLSLVNVDYDLVASMPPQLQLILPGEAAPITIVRRPDVAASPHVWVGELEAAPGAGSVVTLVLSEASRTVTGNVHYTDNATRTMRSFLVSSKDWSKMFYYKSVGMLLVTRRMLLLTILPRAVLRACSVRQLAVGGVPHNVLVRRNNAHIGRRCIALAKLCTAVHCSSNGTLAA
jgi:hypothetical protein